MQGGAIYAEKRTKLTLAECAMIDNKARSGPAVYRDRSPDTTSYDNATVLNIP